MSLYVIVLAALVRCEPSDQWARGQYSDCKARPSAIEFALTEATAHQRLVEGAQVYEIAPKFMGTGLRNRKGVMVDDFAGFGVYRHELKANPQEFVTERQRMGVRF